MIKKVLAVVATLCLSIIGQAQTIAHKVISGENDWTVARRYKIPLKQLHASNPKVNWARLQVGTILSIPGAKAEAKREAAPTPHSAAPASTTGTVAARSDDNDYTIAKRLGVTAVALRKANPGINWARLRPGTKIATPGKAVASAPVRTAAVVAPKAKAAPAMAAVCKAGSDDNDWILARRYGTKPPILRALNPGVNWNKLRPGTLIHLPSSSAHAAAAVAKADAKRIRTHYAVVKTNHVNVRAGARTGAAVALQVDGGTPAVVIDRMGDWYKLKFAHGTKGWVRGDFLEASKKQPKQFALYRKSDAPEIDETPKRVARRDEDDSDRPAKRTRVARVIREAPSHPVSHVQKAKTNHTTVASRSSSSEDRTGDGSSLDRTARSMLGTRYRYGAASRSATDCSGYTSQVFRKLGVSLPRTAHEQSGVGRSVSRSDLKKGDLVFFKTRGSRISHVGIYMGGNKFIHASSGAGHVRISELDGYYARRYAGARRVAKFSGSSSSSKKSTKSTKKEQVETADGG